MRFITNIIHGIRSACGYDFPLIVRLTADECYSYIGQPDKGYDLKEGVKIAKALEALGVDAIDVSSAGYDTFNYWLEPVTFEPGWRKYMAKAIKDAVKIPVIAANLIRSPEQAEQQLEEGTQDMVSLGRPHIADPDWANKAQKGETIRRCICCLNCIESMQTNAYTGGHGECAVNPFVGHEKQELVKNGDGKKVVIAGAGAAGLTAAYILAERGFSVTVLEKSGTPGGQLKLASAPPKKDKIGWFIEDLTAICKKDGVEIVYNTEATAESIKAYEPYAVIVAAGSDPVKPVFGGDYVFEDLRTFDDVLTGKLDVKGKRCVVAGSGLTGLETAEYINEHGGKTVVIDMAPVVAPGTWMQHTDDILPKLKNGGTQFHLGKKLCEIYKDKIIVQDVATGILTEFACDELILALGSAPAGKLFEELKAAGVQNVFNVGDSAKAGRIQNATSTAYKAAISIK